MHRDFDTPPLIDGSQDACKTVLGKIPQIVTRIGPSFASQTMTGKANVATSGIERLEAEKNHLWPRSDISNGW
jgi:hypothetical protein